MAVGIAEFSGNHVNIIVGIGQPPRCLAHAGIADIGVGRLLAELLEEGGQIFGTVA